MNKKLLAALSLVGLFSLASCGKAEKKNDFESFVDCIYDSEAKMLGYQEHDELKMEDVTLYTKDLSFKIIRGSTVRTFTNVTTQTLSNKGGSDGYNYDIVTSSYKTIGKTRYEEINGLTFEQTIDIPTYYLTFVMSNSFLEKGYSLVKADNDYTLTATVLNKNFDQLFIGQTFTNVESADIVVKVENKMLKSFDVKMTSNSGNDISIGFIYSIDDGKVDKTKRYETSAVFMLEGGICQNSTTSVTYKYMVAEDESVFIADPNKLVAGDVTRTGYILDGWYKTKTVDSEGNVTYSNKFDFAVDKMDIEGITLYAKWNKEIKFTYDLVARLYNEDGSPVLDENGVQAEKLIGQYIVNKGDTFNDVLKYCNKYSGFTFMGTYRDADGNIWNDEFVHPGGDDSTAIKVYPDYIEGSYTLVSNKEEFLKAMSGNKGIYLLNDINLGGSEISFKTFNNKIFNGNGHKVSNFKLSSALELTIGFEEDIANAQFYSIFKSVKNSTIKDVEFTNITLDVKVSAYSRLKYIYIAPLAVRVESSEISNVKVTNCNISINNACAEFDFKTSDKIYEADEESVINNVEIIDYVFSDNR